MKHILAFLSILVIFSTAHAQAPLGIPYQAVARNSSGAVIASTAISVRFTIRNSTATGTLLYRETHTTTTDDNGMFSVNVGQGSPVSGIFTSINWSTNSKFLQVELDPTGSSGYTDMGTQQLMSVPYSLYSNNGFPSGVTGDIMYHNGTNWVKLPAGTNGQVLVMSGGIPTWTGCLPPAVQLITASCSVTTIGSSITLSNATTGGTWSSSATSVATVGSSGIVTGVAEGTATISYTVSNACGTVAATRVVKVTPVLSIGVDYQGGKIAYIFTSGDPGYVACETHGIIAAPTDLSSGIQWGCGGGSVSGTSTMIGTGATNTAIIAASCGPSTAAGICNDLVLGGYSDWCLPSLFDITKISPAISAIGGFTLGSFYWTSSDGGPGSAYVYMFGSGATGNTTKTTSYRVRAIRYF